MISQKISKWVAYHPKTVMIICLLLIIPSVFGYLNTRVNYDILSYLPEDLESVQGEQVLDETFHNAASSILIIKDTPARDIQKLKAQIKQIEGVSNVIWADDIMDITVPKEILPDVLTNTFYSQDGESTLLMVQYSTSGSSQTTMDAIKEIRSIMNKNSLLSGLSAITVDTKDLTDSEAPKYIIFAIVLALIALSFTMTSWVLPFVLLAALGIAVIYNMGTNFVFGEISFITQSIAAILQLGVTMDYSVFLMDRFEEEKPKHAEKRDAMAVAINSTFMSLMGSSLTTVFGFLSLCFMSFTLGMDMGLVMAKGVLLGVLCVITFLPSLVLMLDNVIEKTRHKSLVPRFDKPVDFIIKHKKIFAVIFIVLFIPAYLLQSNVNVYYNMDKAIPQDLPSISALNTMKKDFNMATTHFIIVDENLPGAKINAMTDELSQVDGITSVLSLNSIVGTAIPTTVIPDSIKEICVKDSKQLMMLNTNYSSATPEENAQIDQLQSIIKKYDPNGILTGEGVMTKDLITVTDRDFTVTSIISMAAIFLLIAVCLKSATIPLILVASIELAIWLNIGISTILGTTIPFISPTIINCVQLGATVDYAILLTTRFREELHRGLDKTEAIKKATRESCRSIFQSALVFFCATFGVYVISDIDLIKSICAMLARGSVISALVIMFLLAPVLLLLEGAINKTTSGWRKPAEKRERRKNFKEGKTMKKNMFAKSALCLTLVLSMVFSMAACKGKEDTTETTAGGEPTTVEQPRYTNVPGKVTKSETVYVNMNASGEVKDITVTDWLHTDKAEVAVRDVSSLKNIQNVKSEIDPVIEKDFMTWHMNTTDLYYSGKSEKTLPVTVNIKYFLDGKEIKPEKISGKSGKLEMKISVKNNLYTEKTVDGKSAKIYNPMVVVGGFVLPESQFENTVFNGGKLIGDGTKQIAMLVSLPGMNETLGLDELKIEDLRFDTEFTLTADAKNFSIGNMYFAALPLSALGSEITLPDSINDLQSTLGQLKDLEAAISTMDPDKVISTMLSDTNRINELVGMINNAVTLYQNNKVLFDVLPKYMTQENIAKFKKLFESIDPEQMKEVIALINNPVIQSFFKDLPEIAQNMNDVLPLIEQLSKDMSDPQVKAAIDKLPETLKQLSEIQATMDKNKDLIEGLSKLLNEENVDKLNALLETVQTGNYAGKLEDYGILAQDADAMISKLSAMLEYGSSYDIYTEKVQGMSSSVMFIYQTPAIEAQADNTAQSESVTQELPWYKKIFKK